MSAPSPVMQATDDCDTYFYVHTLAVGTDGKLRLLEPERIDLPGQQFIDDSPVAADDPAAQSKSEFLKDNVPPMQEIERHPPAL